MHLYLFLFIFTTTLKNNDNRQEQIAKMATVGRELQVTGFQFHSLLASLQWQVV